MVDKLPTSTGERRIFINSIGGSCPDQKRYKQNEQKTYLFFANLKESMNK